MTARAAQDQELIDRFIEGDKKAFDELMAAHEDRVFAVCLRIMGSREQALDATQETFLTLYRKADRFTGQAAFSTWLYRVTVNTCYDLLRKSKRRAAQSLPDHYQQPDARPLDDLAAVEVRSQIQDAMKQIPDEFRTAVVLIDIEDLSVSEAAQIMGVADGTAKSRVFRGRRLLADLLRNQQDPSRRPRTEQ